MKWLKDIFAGGLEGVLNPIRGLVDDLNLSGEEKEEFKLRFEEILQKRDSEIEETIRTELGAKERIIVAEMQQGDNFTKRARPTVVYVGLAAIIWNYCIVPTINNVLLYFITLPEGTSFEAFHLPVEFWAAWGGIVATWSIGRSAEKRGVRNKATRLITGAKSLLD